MYQNPNYTDVIFQKNCLFQRLSAAVFNSLKYMCGLHCRSEKNHSLKITMCGLASRPIEVSTDSHENIFLYQSGILQARWNTPSNELRSHVDLFDASQVSCVVHVSFESNATKFFKLWGTKFRAGSSRGYELKVEWPGFKVRIYI